MDTSASSQLDNSLNDSVTDGEENVSEASLSDAAPPQVYTLIHTHLDFENV